VFSSVADPDPVSGAFLTPESGIRDGKKIRTRIIFPRAQKFFFLGLKYLNSLMRIRGGKNLDPESGVEKIRIQDIHPGFATLEFRTEKSEPEKNSSAVWPTVLRIRMFLNNQAKIVKKTLILTLL
jgi:hypothetical protein